MLNTPLTSVSTLHTQTLHPQQACSFALLLELELWWYSLIWFGEFFFWFDFNLYLYLLVWLEIGNLHKAANGPDHKKIWDNKWNVPYFNCWDGQKDRVIFWIRKKQEKLPPQVLSATVVLTFTVNAPLTSGVRPGSLNLTGETPKAATCQLSAAPSKERTYCWNQKISLGPAR